MPVSCQNHSRSTALNQADCILQDKRDCVYRRPPKLMNRDGLLVASSLPPNRQVGEHVSRSWESKDGQRQ